MKKEKCIAREGCKRIEKTDFTILWIFNRLVIGRKSFLMMTFIINDFMIVIDVGRATGRLIFRSMEQL